METSAENKNSPSLEKNTAPTSPPIEISRKFAASVDRVFKAFTTAEDLQSWWWPKGLYSDRVEIDFREGGRFFINMKGYDQGGGGMTGEFEQIIPNERVVMTDRFADREGRPISAKEAGMHGVWPEIIRITYEFGRIDADTTRFRLSQTGIPADAQKDCIQGWSESFDKLDRYLGDPVASTNAGFAR